MSYLVTKFQRWHLPYVLQNGPLEQGAMLDHDPETLRAMELSPNTWTAVVDGVPVASGGTLALWPGRHMAWAYLGRDAKKAILAISRTAYDVVHRPKGRVECTARADFPPAQKWAKVLGFRVETERLEHYGPGGEDHVGFVLVNGG